MRSDLRYCRTCETNKPLDDFYNRSDRKGKMGTCKPCRSERNKIRNKNMADPRTATQLRDKSLRQKYGITFDEFEGLALQQGWYCGVCQGIMGPPGRTAGSAVVDHCHDTGKIRSILCRECNLGLGNFRDSALILANAIAYLATPPGDINDGY